MPDHKPDLLRPALIGGAIGALFSIVPPLCCLNLCCCLDYVIAGAIGGAFYARRASAMAWYPGPGEGASVGAVAGAFAGFVHGTLVALVLGLASLVRPPQFRHGSMEVSDTFDWGRRFGDATRDLYLDWSPLAAASTHLVSSVLLGAIAGIFGGMIGVALFRGLPPRAGVGPLPPAPPAEPPSSPPYPPSSLPPSSPPYPPSSEPPSSEPSSPPYPSPSAPPSFPR
jgi:hypothetical protein